MSIHLSHDERQNQVLNAALSVFGRYGFKRTSMEDIAKEAGISRAALYLRFENKAAIFMALALATGEQACAGAEAAWSEPMGFAQGLAASATALHVPLWQIINTMPHGRELVEADQKVVGEVKAAVDARYGALIEGRALRWPCSASNGDHAMMARICVAGLNGIKQSATSQSDLERAITAFAGFMAIGVER
jgi:AcrR family transcriptional regulator